MTSYTTRLCWNSHWWWSIRKAFIACAFFTRMTASCRCLENIHAPWHLRSDGHSNSIVLRVVTGVTIQYMADVSVIWVWLTILLYYKIETHSHDGNLSPAVWSHSHSQFLRESQVVTPVTASHVQYDWDRTRKLKQTYQYLGQIWSKKGKNASKNAYLQALQRFCTQLL